MQLSKGYVTQNGRWVSYKTWAYSESISTYQLLAEELEDALKKLGIETDGDFHAVHVSFSQFRIGCVTVKVYSTDKRMAELPYESHSVN